MKSFSWTLALRYLNPLRTFVSIITLLSLVGVAFGVMVLIVVLSVHNGFERNLKDTLLGFSPHVTVMRSDGGPVENWEEMEETLGEVGSCTSAYAFIEGFALLDSKDWQRPVNFRAIHSGNEDQIDALTDLLDLENHPKGRADMGLEQNAVISKQLADRLGLSVGDEIRLLAASNLEAVLEVTNVPEERATDLYPKVFEEVEKMVTEGFVSEAGVEYLPTVQSKRAYELLNGLVPLEVEAQPMRKYEKDLVIDLLVVLEKPDLRKDGRDQFESGTKESLQGTLAELREFDLKEIDNQAYKSIEEFVTPKTFVVWGVYSDNLRSQGPAMFIPLEIGMELKDLDFEAEAMGVLTEDPYEAEQTAQLLQKELGGDWYVQSWMRTFSQQFELVKTEKVMMSFALSFITLLSAFSIMAVMYTVTVQKRQEIGVMKALGARPSQIVRVFLYQGIIVGVGGALLGLGLGLLAIRYREGIVGLLRGIGIDAFPKEFHGMSSVPARVVPEQLVFICIVAIILCVLAALVPALMAAFRDPAKSLRNL